MNHKSSYWQFHTAVTDHTNSIRSILKRVDSSQFEMLWNQSTEEQRKEVIALIYDGNRHGLRAWMGTHSALKAEDWGYNQLRDRAKKLGVCNYSRITRDELIQAIMEKESANEENRDVGRDRKDVG